MYFTRFEKVDLNLINNKIFYITVSLILFSLNIYAQPIDENREIIIKSFSVNDSQNTYESQEIILFNTDSISFFYGLQTKTGSPKDPFLFRLSLKINSDSSVFNTGQNFISYKGLAEGKYILKVSGFDLQRRWSAKAVEIEFEVDNKKAQLIKELDSLKKIEEQNKLASVNAANKENTFNYTTYLIVGLVLIVIGILIIIFKKIEKIRKSNGNNKKGTLMIDNNSFVARDEFDKIVTENSELRAEIAALRGQIDALNVRGEQLSKQNKELQTNLNKLENSKDELEELQKQKDELFAVVIHDIKNPASLIKSLVELLTSYDLTATEQQDIIKDIAQTTSKIVSLSQEVTKILSLESTKIHLNFDLNDMNEVIRDVNQRNQIAAKNKSINLYTDLMANLPQAEFDFQKIDEVLDNLVSNAIKFTPNGGTVRIKSSKELNNIVVEISDNGLGLSEDDLKQTFKRGVKLSAQPTAGESSTGLGLWIVKKLVETHNGRVWVKSLIGKGSTFAFSIPLKQNK